MKNHSIWKKYGYFWVTLVLFLGSLIGHWTFAWFAYIEEQQSHSQPVEVKGYLVEVSRDTLENWQSEFLQLIWQVAGLAYLFYVGSPQSREEDDRLEEKIDYILKKVDSQNGEKKIKELDEYYVRNH